MNKNLRSILNSAKGKNAKIQPKLFDMYKRQIDRVIAPERMKKIAVLELCHIMKADGK